MSVVILMTSVIGIQKAHACHLAAADISVTYSGPGLDGCTGTAVYKYDVELVVYYGCITCVGNGAQNATINYSSASAIADGLPTPTGSFIVNDPKLIADTAHQLCAQFKDSNS